jgi:uncharacterized cupin superfamily protein
MVKKTRKKTARAPTTTVNRDGCFEPFNIDDIPWRKLRGSTAFKEIGRYGGGSQVEVGIDVMKPGEYSNRFHYHSKDEEHVFILKGSATLVLGRHEYVLKERDYCCFPAGQKAGHHLFNHTKRSCVFMTVGDNRPGDLVCYPRTRNARLRAAGREG